MATTAAPIRRASRTPWTTLAALSPALRTIVAGYAFDCLVLAGFVVAQAVAVWPVLAFAVVGLLHCTVALLVAPGVERRPTRTWLDADTALGAVAHLGLATLVATGFAVFVPEVGVVFLATLLLLLGAAAVHLERLQAVSLSVAAVLLLGLLLVLFDQAPALPGGTQGQRLVLWAGFTLLVVRMALLGGEAHRLRVVLAERERELQSLLERARLLAGVDELTQALNRRSVLTMLADARDRSSRYGAPLCVAMLDLDHFKAINDRFGHPVGDQVLVRFVQLVQRLVRSTDRVGRMGGEEFLLVLGETGELPARRALERLRATVAEYDWSELAAELSVTVSAGLAEYRPGESVEQLLERADQALYEAKRSGRNRVRMH